MSKYISPDRNVLKKNESVEICYEVAAPFKNVTQQDTFFQKQLDYLRIIKKKTRNGYNIRLDMLRQYRNYEYKRINNCYRTKKWDDCNYHEKWLL